MYTLEEYKKYVIVNIKSAKEITIFTTDEEIQLSQTLSRINDKCKTIICIEKK